MYLKGNRIITQQRQQHTIQSRLMIIGVVEGFTNIHAHANWDPYYSQGLCGTCKKMLFLVCTVVEWVCKVSVVDAILWGTMLRGPG